MPKPIDDWRDLLEYVFGTFPELDGHAWELWPELVDRILVAELR